MLMFFRGGYVNEEIYSYEIREIAVEAAFAEEISEAKFCLTGILKRINK